MLVSGVSPLSVDETALKLQNIIKDKGLKIFGVFEHSKLAKEVNLQMNDTVVLLLVRQKPEPRLCNVSLV
ncbi:Uncharacterized conserved protein [Campylobacter hyointestinalis subsp. hyointestinalis]|uniref:Uncharacterized conserved protein n=2 Tax=Campylobacter hyointestinalis TaxID=198 RepID=A0A0S4RSN3_CAMHY|nr:hypothetical protein [Campylobacter hyointestinalis]CUU76245.1 Uncharacterized conserved protein [Campylobacter hyointestinalis subsp. hyointestinalis]